MSKRIEILQNEECIATREKDSNKDWDASDLSYNISIIGYKIVEEEDYFDLYLPEGTEPGEDIFLVSVNYSTGDSFHREDGLVDFIEVFKHREDAEALAKEIRKIDDKNNRTYNFKFKVPSTQEILTISTGYWTGYFDNLNYIEVNRISCTGQNRF